MYLRDRAGGGSCWLGVKTIAHDLHLSPRTVQRALNDLERAGYIQRQRRHLSIVHADDPALLIFPCTAAAQLPRRKPAVMHAYRTCPDLVQ